MDEKMYTTLTKIKRFFFKPVYRRLDEIELKLKLLNEKYDRLFARQIIDNIYFENQSRKDVEKQEIADFLKQNPLTVFPYNFTKKYNFSSIEVNFDNNCSMSYVIHENKRLYFPKDWRKEKIQHYYNGLLIEQDEESPHRYLTTDFTVEEYDVVVDIGTAEGIFGLSVVEKVKTLYLFECENFWIEALRETFRPWKEKIHIVNKYVSDRNNDTCITMDEFFNIAKGINLIKADIEGAEVNLLDGAKRILAECQKLKLILCTYHRQDDSKNIEKILKKSRFEIEYTKGYMLFLLDKDLCTPYLRKGVIRAIKDISGKK
jgi:hypothetical protein